MVAIPGFTWPPDYRAILLKRIKRYKWICKNRECIPEMLSIYKKDKIKFVEDWGVTVDPRRTTFKLLPFILFPRQKQFMTFIDGCVGDKVGGLAEKARDMGITWECGAWAAHDWLFTPGTSIGFGSLKTDKVDRLGDPDSIFEKIRVFLHNLPPFFLPVGFRWSIHSNYMKLVNPETGAIIKGESGEDIGRGGRSKVYFKDESAHYKKQDTIEAALGDNTDVQIDVSSVNGTANLFYRRRMSGELWTPDAKFTPGRTRVFIFDWRDHPGKTQEWYDARRTKAIREGLLHIFAQEVERNYSGSQERVIISPEWVEACVDAHKVISGMEVGESVAAQDVADGGADRNAYGYRKGVVLKFAEAWGGNADAAAEIAVPYCITYGASELHYDSIGVGASFKTSINNLKKTMPGYPKKLRVFPWNAGAEVLDPEDNIIPWDQESPTNEDTYENLKAQAWFRLRARIWKTYRMIRHGEKYPVGELLSIDSTIPCLEQIKVELSQAKHKASVNGRTLVEKKPEGEPSPNLADMVVILYNPNRDVSIFDVI